MSRVISPVLHASRVYVFAALALSAWLAVTIVAQPAQAAQLQSRIVNGTQVGAGTYTKWNFMVALIDPAAANAGSGQFCAGSLISPTRVVTAAHCVLDPNTGGAIKPASVKVLAGRRTLSDNASGQMLAVASVIVNPNYDQYLNTSDIAVLRLATPATMGTPIQPVHAGEGALWGGGLGLVSNSTDGPFIGGWGSLGEAAALPDTLREAELPLISDSACADGGGANGIGYGNIFDPNTMMCAGTLDTSDPSTGATTNGVDSCYGDSGGPLIVGSGGTFHLAGIVSFGFRCADRSSYGIYTRLGAFSSWIDSDPPTLPVSTARPTVSGSPAVGSTVSCSTGGWTSESLPLTYSYEWGYGDTVDGVDGPAFGVQRIDNATSQTYKPTNDDSFNRLVCIVTATSAAGSTSRASIPTEAVIGGNSTVADVQPFTTRIISTTCLTRVCTINVQLQNLTGTRVVALDAIVTVGHQIHRYSGVQVSGDYWTITVPRAKRRQAVRITATDRLGVASASRRSTVKARDGATKHHHAKRHRTRRHVASKQLARAATASGHQAASAATGTIVHTRRTVTPRIINGNEVTAPNFAARWPWVASLQIIGDRNHPPSAVDGHTCTGSLITPTRVLVAAHCVTSGSDVDEANLFDVIVGRRDLRDSDGQRRTISAIYVDPQYDSSNLGDHDAAIVEFADPIAGITPVDIVQPGDSAEWGGGIGKAISPPDGPFVAGWGARRALYGFTPVSLPSALNEGAVPIVADLECANGGTNAGTGWGRYFDALTMMCAGQLDTSDPSLGVPNGTTVCNGDSGGPLIVKVAAVWKVAGITSFGSSGCSTRDAPAVFTRVDGERNWINGAHGEPVRFVYPDVTASSSSKAQSTSGLAVTGDPVEHGELGCPTGNFSGPNITYARAWFRTVRPDETGNGDSGFSFFSTAQKAQFARHLSRSYPLDQLVTLLGVETIDGETSATYAPTRADVGVQVGCIIVATNPDWSTFAIPGASAPVAVAGFHGSAVNAKFHVLQNRCHKSSCTIVLRVSGAGAKSLVRVGGWRITRRGETGDLSSMGGDGGDGSGGPPAATPVVWAFDLPKQKAGAHVTLLGWDDLGHRTKVLTLKVGK